MEQRWKVAAVKAKHLQGRNSSTGSLKQSLAPKDFYQCTKNNGYIYSYVLLSKYFSALENGAPCFEIPVTFFFFSFLVKPLKLKLEVFTLIRPWLFYFKSTVVVYKSKIIKTVTVQIHWALTTCVWTRMLTASPDGNKTCPKWQTTDCSWRQRQHEKVSFVFSQSSVGGKRNHRD